MKRKISAPLTAAPLRHRAEARLRAQSGGGNSAAGVDRSPADARRLLHELQVHQVELEMQNEELRKARDEMEAGLEKYSDLYDFAPVGYVTLNREGAIIEANLTVASLLGIPRGRLMAQRLGGLVTPADRPLFTAFFKQIFENKSRQECDVQLLVKDHPPVDVRIRANRSGSGAACRMAISDITQHKLAEAVSSQLAAIVTSSSDAIIGKDLNSVITSWNAGAEKIFGYTASEMVGQSVFRLIPPDRQDEEKQILSQIRKGESVRNLETIRVTKSGRRLEMAITISPIRHTGGKIAGASKVARDITERRQAEEKVRVSEIRYRRLFEAAHDGVLLLDPATRKITDANPFMTKLLGYGRAELIGKELFEIGLLKDETASQEMFRKLKRIHEVRYEDLPLESQDGRHQEVEVVANLYQEDGRPVIQCNIRDITARKQAEQALQASEQRFRALFDLGPVGVYSCDASGKIHEFNRCAVELWGRKPNLDDPRERFCGSHKLYLPNGRPLPHQACPMALVLSGKIPAAHNLEVGCERPDGSRITLVVNIVPLKNERAEITGAINCFYDITERKQAEVALREAQAKLSEYAGQLEKMVAVRTVQLTATNRRLEASVQFIRKSREEYRALFLKSELMQKKLRLLTHQIISAQEDERRKISRELHDEVVQTLVGINVELSALGQTTPDGNRILKARIARTQRLVEKSVNAVHQFARELRPALLDDLGLIPALHSYVKSLAERKDLQIRLTAFAGVEALENDKRTVLYRITQEALTNIGRHAEASLVDVSISRIPGAIRLEVRDNGKSFQVAQTLSVNRNKRLGLLGMRERVEMVGGTLSIISAPGNGTTVRAEIPLKLNKIKK